ncbi:MAG: hypothetical protein MJK04_31025, partial [Psychrosphaera sp.]|nr:hypothetical protein [Psychrosphaera sp.]
MIVSARPETVFPSASWLDWRYAAQSQGLLCNKLRISSTIRILKRLRKKCGSGWKLVSNCNWTGLFSTHSSLRRVSVYRCFLMFMCLFLTPAQPAQSDPISAQYQAHFQHLLPQHKQPQHKQHNARHFGQYSAAQGLSHNQVSDILQDSSGFLWIATYEGLNRFDGFEFKVFRASEDGASGLGSNYTTSLVEDNEGNLWVGGAQGVTRLALNTYQFKHFDFNQLTNQPGIFVNQLHLDGQNRLWVASNDGVFRFNRQQQSFERIKLPKEALLSGSNDIKALNILQVKSDSKGNIWLLIDDQGVFQLNEESATLQALSTPNPQAVRTMWFDQIQRLWLGN